MDWFFKQDNSEVGPLDDEAFATHILEGRIDMDTLVWHVDMNDWVPLSEIIKQEAKAANHEAAAAFAIEEASQPEPPPALALSSTRSKLTDVRDPNSAAGGEGTLLPVGARASLPTAESRLKLIQRSAPPALPGAQPKAPDSTVPETVAPEAPPDNKTTTPKSGFRSRFKPEALPRTEEAHPASFARRLMADAIDITLAVLLTALAWWLAPSALKHGVSLLALISALLLFGVMIPALPAMIIGSTPGLRVARLKLHSEIGHRCGPARCLAYGFALLITTCTLGTGMLSSILVLDRRPLHDLIAGTRADRPGD